MLGGMAGASTALVSTHASRHWKCVRECVVLMELIAKCLIPQLGARQALQNFPPVSALIQRMI